MASYAFKDAAGTTQYAKVFGGTGTSADPYLLTSANVEISNYTQPPRIPVTSSGQTLLAVNANRLHTIVKNCSQTDAIELTFGSTLLAYGQGMPLFPGEAYEINASNLYRGVVKARSASGVTVDVAVMEG